MRPGAETRRFGRTASLLSGGRGRRGRAHVPLLLARLAQPRRDRVRRDRRPVVCRVRDDLGRLQAGRAAPVAHARRPDRARRGHRPGDPHRRADPGRRFAHACAEHPALSRARSKTGSCLARKLSTGSLFVSVVAFGAVVLHPRLSWRAPAASRSWRRCSSPSRQPERSSRSRSRSESPTGRRRSRSASRRRRW